MEIRLISLLCIFTQSRDAENHFQSIHSKWEAGTIGLNRLPKNKHFSSGRLRELERGESQFWAYGRANCRSCSLLRFRQSSLKIFSRPPATTERPLHCRHVDGSLISPDISRETKGGTWLREQEDHRMPQKHQMSLKRSTGGGLEGSQSVLEVWTIEKAIKMHKIDHSQKDRPIPLPIVPCLSKVGGSVLIAYRWYRQTSFTLLYWKWVYSVHEEWTHISKTSLYDCCCEPPNLDSLSEPVYTGIRAQAEDSRSSSIRVNDISRYSSEGTIE